MFPKISIITVVYNDAAHIIETMDSVINQSYENIEYILIDGGSSDGTRDIIKSKLRELGTLENAPRPTHISPKSLYLQARHKHKPNFCFKFLSEKDSGIYDAMNKGIDLATGQWCNFMNCGDRFYSHSSIEEIFRQCLNSNQGGVSEFAVIYGDTQLVYNEKHAKILYATSTSHKYQHGFVHQSAFITTSLMRHYKYDTSFKIAGDTDFFAKAYNNGAKFLHFDIIISSFVVEGISSIPSWQRCKEVSRIAAKYSRFMPLFLIAKHFLWSMPCVAVYLAIPQKLRAPIRRVLSRNKS